MYMNYFDIVDYHDKPALISQSIFTEIKIHTYLKTRSNIYREIISVSLYTLSLSVRVSAGKKRV